jgi:hypothetical protein
VEGINIENINDQQPGFSIFVKVIL